jgi:hypothetical protein
MVEDWLGNAIAAFAALAELTKLIALNLAKLTQQFSTLAQPCTTA